MKRNFWMAALPLMALMSACATAPETTNLKSITAQTSDDVQIYGEQYFGKLDKSAPLILLFHQGGSNGRAEYEPLIPWLNAAGFRAIAWDQRRGGERLGGENRTVNGLPSTSEFSYCEVAPDLQAALDYALNTELANQVILWGSSYSASLVFELAANNPGKVSGVIAFSPAGGGPLENCRARMWAPDLDIPMMALRPAREMEMESTQSQKQILMDQGVNFHVVENGVHGSSMLVDERTKSDMSADRTIVLRWLNSLAD